MPDFAKRYRKEVTNQMKEETITLAEAIKRLSQRIAWLNHWEEPGDFADMKLGIEALKREQSQRVISTELEKMIIKYLSDNIALYDCQDSCPDEVALNEDLRTADYCNKCFAKQIIALVKEAGYVKLADDQSKPEELLNQESKEDWFSAYGIMDVLNAWRECYQSMLRAGWRKVEGI